MNEISYGNCHETRAKYRGFAVYDNLYVEIVAACKGHYGFGGEVKTSWYVNASEWDKCLGLINEAIETGHSVYRRQKHQLNNTNPLADLTYIGE